MKNTFPFFLLLALIAPLVLANPASNHERVSSENVSTPSLVFENFSNSYLVKDNLALSIAIIDNEMETLRNKPFRLSDKEIHSLKQNLLVRFHPEELEKTLLIHLQQTSENTQQEFVALQEVLSSPIATQLALSRQTALKPNKKNETLDYQEKLQTENVQQHRIKIARAYDGLQKLSLIQALLFQEIQNSVQKSLNEKHRARYTTGNESERLEETQQFNQALNLYAFRQVPAEDFIIFFDSLAKPSVQSALNTYVESLKKTLNERAKLEFVIENE